MKIDDDLRAKNAGELRKEIMRLRSAIRSERDHQGNRRCWTTLENVLPEGGMIKPLCIPRSTFLRNCARYFDRNSERPLILGNVCAVSGIDGKELVHSVGIELELDGDLLRIGNIAKEDIPTPGEFVHLKAGFTLTFLLPEKPQKMHRVIFSDGDVENIRAKVAQYKARD